MLFAKSQNFWFPHFKHCFVNNHQKPSAILLISMNRNLCIYAKTWWTSSCFVFARLILSVFMCVFAHKIIESAANIYCFHCCCRSWIHTHTPNGRVDGTKAIEMQLNVCKLRWKHTYTCKLSHWWIFAVFVVVFAIVLSFTHVIFHLFLATRHYALIVFTHTSMKMLFIKRFWFWGKRN